MFCLQWFLLHTFSLSIFIFSFFFFQGCNGPTNGTSEPANEIEDLINEYIANATEVQIINGDFEEKIKPTAAPGKVFDARDSQFINYDEKWAMIYVEGGPRDIDMYWIGGYVRSNKPWDASWDDHKDLDGPTRNSSALEFASTNTTLSGVHFFNVHDGVRTNKAFNWGVEHTWGEYIRDDCIENDHLNSGRIYDCLFDGCYTGISTRPSRGDTLSNGQGKLVEVDRVLLRLQAMPYPYKWETKEGIIDVNGKRYEGSGIPYGHGNLFKITSDGPNPNFIIKNSVFLASHLTKKSHFDFPPETLIKDCENNTIIWLGPDRYPGELPTRKFPDCFKIVTGDKGLKLWRDKVADWHARHPNVGKNRKPGTPGSLKFPKTF